MATLNSLLKPSRTRTDLTVRSPSIALSLLLAACTGAAQAAPYVMERDPGCPCCDDWADHVEKELGVEIVTRDRPEAGAATSHDEGVPAMLASSPSRNSTPLLLLHVRFGDRFPSPDSPAHAAAPAPMVCRQARLAP